MPLLTQNFEPPNALADERRGRAIARYPSARSAGLAALFVMARTYNLVVGSRDNIEQVLTYWSYDSFGLFLKFGLVSVGNPAQGIA
jgi:hypothetical protein